MLIVRSLLFILIPTIAVSQMVDVAWKSKLSLPGKIAKIIPVKNGNYLLIGESGTYGAYLYLGCVDSNGDSVSTYIHSRYSNSVNDADTLDNGNLIIPSKYMKTSSGQTAYTYMFDLFEFDQSSNFVSLEMDSIYSGFQPMAICHTKGGFAITGYSWLLNSPHFPVLYRLDRFGRIINKIGYQSLNGETNDIVSDHADNLYMWGYHGSDSADMWLMKTDSLGAIAWEKMYAGYQSDQGDAITLCNNKPVVFGTFIDSINTIPTPCLFMSMLDTDGNKIWEKQIEKSTSKGIVVDNKNRIVALATDFIQTRIIYLTETGDILFDYYTNGNPNTIAVDKNNFLLIGGIRSFSAATAYSVMKLGINNPPYFTDLNIPTYDTCYEDKLYSFQFIAKDSFPGDFVKYSISLGKISTMKIDSSDGIFIWTPTTELDSGKHILAIVCTDRLNQKDTIQFTLFVRAVNDPPVITTVIPDVFELDSLYSIPLIATDEESDTITWMLSKKPSTMIVDTNKLVWKPAAAGLDTIVLVATDGTSNDTLISIVNVLAPEGTRPLSLSEIPIELSLSTISNQGSIRLMLGVPYGISCGTIRIFTISGKLFEGYTISGSGWHTVNLPDHYRGVLIAKMSAGGKTVKKRIIIP